MDTGLTPLPSGWQGEAFAMMEHGPSQARVLGGDGHDRFPITSALLQRHRPAADGIGLGFGEGQNGSGAQDQQGSEVGVAGFGDPAQPGLAARTALARHQPQPGRELPATAEVVLVHPVDREHVLGEIDPNVHNSYDFPSRVR